MIALRQDTSTARLSFLDSLRALAVIAVLLAHMLSEIWPTFARFRFSFFDLGSFGVTVFFICSGFIIPPSIEHAPSLRVFWYRRFYRLYPLYWCSILLTAAIIGLELARPSSLLVDATLPTVLANLTMVQTFLGAPHLQVVYWSLTFELLFYLFVTLLVLLKLHRQSTAITAGLIIATLLIEVLSPLLSGTKVPLNLSGFLVIMFSGVLFQRVAEGCLRLRYGMGLALGGLAVNCAAALVDSWVRFGSLWQNLYLISAWIAAFAVFIGVYLLREHRLLALPAFLAIGRISYSMYLLHLPVILVVPLIGGPLIGVLIWSLLSIGLALVAYRLIEAPMIALGRAGAPKDMRQRAGHV